MKNFKLERFDQSKKKTNRNWKVQTHLQRLMEVGKIRQIWYLSYSVVFECQRWQKIVQFNLKDHPQWHRRVHFWILYPLSRYRQLVHKDHALCYWLSFTEIVLEISYEKGLMLQYNPFFPTSFLAFWIHIVLSDLEWSIPNGSFQLITLELKSFQLNNSIELDFPTIRIRRIYAVLYGIPVKCFTAF